MSRSPLKKCGIVLISVISVLIFAVPAHANVPLGWGLYSVTSLISLSRETNSLALIAVILIEALVFKALLKCTWKQALFASLMLNIISTALGVFVGAFVFMGFFVFFAFVLVPIIGWLLLNKPRAPLFFKLTASLTFCVGLIIALWAENITYDFSRVDLYIIVLFGLLVGFGLTLMIEGLFLKAFLKTGSIWKALMMANLVTYLLLAGLNLYYAPSIYSTSHLIRYEIRHMIEKDDLNGAVTLIEKKYDNMQYLLGLRDDNVLQYNATFWEEVEILESCIKRRCHPRIPYAIALVVSKHIPEKNIDLSQDYAKLSQIEKDILRFRWLLKYYEYFDSAANAKDEQDYETLESIMEEWSEWYESNRYPDKSVYEGYESNYWKDEYIHPRNIIQILEDDNEN